MTGMRKACLRKALTKPAEVFPQFLFIMQNYFRGAMEHDVIIPVYEGARVGFITDAALSFCVTITKLKASAFIRDSSVEQKQDSVAPVHMFTVELEEVLAFWYAFDHVRQICHATALPLREKGLVSTSANDCINLLVKLALTLRE